MSHQATKAELASSIEDSRVPNDKKRFTPISHQAMRQCKTSRTHARVETSNRNSDKGVLPDEGIRFYLSCFEVG
jgi:hypothetical protein